MSTEDDTKPQRLTEIIIWIVSVLWRYKWLIIVPTGLISTAVVVYAYISIKLPAEQSPMPNVYTATATLLVYEGESSEIESFLTSVLASPVSGLNHGEIMVRVLRSRSILDELIQRFDMSDRYNIERSIRTNTRKRVRSAMEVDYESASGGLPSRGTGVLSIGYTDIDPEFARDVVNGAVELLEDWFLSIGTRARNSRTVQVETKLERVDAEISRLEGQIQAFQREYGVLSVDELAAMRTSTLSDLRSQLILKDIEIRQRASYANINDPGLIQLRTERENIAELLQDIEDGTSEYNDILPSGAELSRLSAEYNRLTTDIEIQRKIYESLSQQYETLRLNIQSEPAFRVLEYAETPDLKSGPSRTRMVIAAFVLAFLGSTGVAFLANMYREAELRHQGVSHEEPPEEPDASDE